MPRTTFRSVAPRLIACLLAVGAITPAAAHAGVGTKVVADCADDSKLTKKYSAAEYADALRNIPTDVDEYTDCRDVIRRAQLGIGGTSTGGDSGSGSGAGGTTGGSGGGTGSAGGAGGDTGSGGGTGSGLGDYDAALSTATPQERASIDKLKAAPSTVDIGGQQLRSDSLGHGELGSLNSLPSPFVVILLLMALGTVCALIPKLRSLVRTRVQRTA
ncbi:hypothetical protein [Paraconexibacter sp. AEG42_29]|uniref:hypothetical protein n=1 Tax=Paraconexibacter sp. AEG42_29 TaxID=2997339 RepID=UPI00339D4604